MPIAYRDAMAYVVEGACSMDVRCWRDTNSVEVYGELAWLCTIHLNNWYEQDIFKVANVYLRDRGVVTGDNEVIFTVAGHPHVPVYARALKQKLLKIIGVCSPRAFFCFCHAAHQISPLFDAPAPNTPRTPTNRNTMLATSTTIKWPFPLNSLKHGTKSSVTSGTTSLGIPKYQVQQTRLLHLAKGRKVSRKVICDAVGIYYATTTGNTEAAAEWVKDLMVRKLISRISLSLDLRLLTTFHPTAWRHNRRSGNRRGQSFRPERP